jgi:pilus assembly protein CpaE
MTSELSLAPTVTGASPEPASLALTVVRDRDSEGLIRHCLADLGVPNSDFVLGDIDTAIEQLGQRRSPRLLIVDISGVTDPVAHIARLFEVCGPTTGIVAIGTSNDITLYRSLRDAGVVEYYFKPLVSNLVARTCNGILTGTQEQPAAHTGKLVFVLGVRGGTGATTITTNMAWHLAEARKRQVMLLDLDLHSGDAALQLDARPSHALLEALDHPERVDDLFLERGLIHVTDRLSLLASLEPLGTSYVPSEETVLSILGNLLQRYRYVFVDFPSMLAAALQRALHLSSTCLLVSDGSLASARDVARWRELIGPNSSERTTLHILNKAGSTGSLPAAEFAHAAGQAPDFTIPYDREIASAATLGVRGTQKATALQSSLTPVYQLLTGEKYGAAPSLFKRIFG